MRLAPVVTLLGLVIAGCSDNPVKVQDTPPTEKQAWIGSYTSGSGNGDVVMDLGQTGSAIKGEMIIGPTSTLYVPVTGERHLDSMFVGLDPAYGPSSNFSMRVQVLPNKSISGTIKFPSAGINANISCRPLPRRSVETDVTYNISADAISMVFDGSLLWVGTLEDYRRMDPTTGATVDHILIPHRSGIWTASELMFDGTVIWGTYPITIMYPSGSVNVADLLGFNASGRTADSIRVAHRPHGLAYDGAHYWSLRGEPGPRELVRFDLTGALTDSLPLGIPDATDLAFDGTHFWTQGWSLERLYEVDASGQVVAICDPPRTGPSILGPITAEGSHIWYGETRIGSTTLHRMTLH